MVYVTLWIFLLCIIKSFNAVSFGWKEYPNYDCDLISSAFDIKYELSLSQCQQSCVNTTNCKGVSWYQYLKKDVNNDPSRCYLLNKMCDLQYFNSSPAVTSFWYSDITQDTECINYPLLWTDKYSDDCDYYSLYGICDNAFNQTSKAFILNDYDSVYHFNAFQVCCSCVGSLFQYKHDDNTFVMETLWKPSQSKDITDNMICQSYNKYIRNVPDFSIKWNINRFLGICSYFTNKVNDKYALIYSLSSNPNEDLQAIDYQQLKKYDCINSNVFNNNNVTFFVCNKFDYVNYPYIIDISSEFNYKVYLNEYFIDTKDFTENVKNNMVIFQSQCNIASLINNNDKSNIIASLLCEYKTKSPTNYPSTNPTVIPTKYPSMDPTKYPTKEPTFDPTKQPTLSPSDFPSISPTQYPTNDLYSDKKQVTAFCLTFFFGVFGAGRWYIGDDSGGIWQLIMLVFGCCCAIGGGYCIENDGEDAGQGAVGCGGCCCCGLLIWILVDLVAFANNSISDENGMPLDPW